MGNINIICGNAQQRNLCQYTKKNKKSYGMNPKNMKEMKEEIK